MVCPFSEGAKSRLDATVVVACSRSKAMCNDILISNQSAIDRRSSKADIAPEGFTLFAKLVTLKLLPYCHQIQAEIYMLNALCFI